MEKKNSKGKLKIAALILSVALIAALGAIFGVYAATQSFQFQVTSSINIDIVQVDGNLYATRFGDVIYTKMGEHGDEEKETRVDGINVDRTANMTDFIQIYGRTNNDVPYSADSFFWNLQEIQYRVNFLSESEDKLTEDNKYLTIYYAFRFEYDPASPANVNVTLTNNSTQLDASDARKDKVSMQYKYQFASSNISNWSQANIKSYMSSATSFGVDAGGSKTIQVISGSSNTHFLYIYASLTVERTDSLSESYTLGIDEEFNWAFNLDFDPVSPSGEVVG